MLVSASTKTTRATKKKAGQKKDLPSTTLSAPDAVPETVSEAATKEDNVQAPPRKSARGKKKGVRSDV